MQYYPLRLEDLKYQYYCDKNLNIYKFYKNKYVPLKVENDGRVTLFKNKKRYNIHYIPVVLDAFYGGYFKRRKYTIIDNKAPLTIDNIEWKRGFKKGIDKMYLLSLNDGKLSEENYYIKYFLLTNKSKYLNKVLEKNKGLFYTIFKEDYGIPHKFNSWFENFKEKFYKLVEKGAILPVENSNKLLIYLRVFVNFEAKKERLSIIKNKELFIDITPEFSEKITSNKSVYFENDVEYEDLDEEIEDMFNYFSN